MIEFNPKSESELKSSFSFIYDEADAQLRQINVPALHNKGATFAFADSLYVRPQYRKGMLMLRALKLIKEDLKALGFTQFQAAANASFPRVASLFKALGMTELQTTYGIQL